MSFVTELSGGMGAMEAVTKLAKNALSIFERIFNEGWPIRLSASPLQNTLIGF